MAREVKDISPAFAQLKREEFALRRRSNRRSILDINNPIVWIVAIIILALFLTGGFSGGFEAFSKFGKALKSLPTGVWAFLIILFFWRFAMRGGERGKRR